MIEAFVEALGIFLRGLVYVGMGLVVLVVAKFARDLITRHGIDEEVIQKQNLAEALRLCGYFIGVILVLLGAMYHPLTVIGVEGLGFNAEYGMEVLRVFLYSIAGIIALNLVRPLIDRVILYKFNVEKEVIEDRNVGTGAAEFGINVAVGLIIAGALTGEGGGSELTGALVTLAFFGMGVVLLVLFALFYEFTASYDVHDEIERDNAAVGIAFGGNLIAIGVVMFKALFGDFTGWGDSIVAFVVFGVIGFVLLYVLRLLIDLLLLPHIRISGALVGQRNVGVAFVESAVVISASMVLFMAI